MMTEKKRKATTDTLATITDNCYEVLPFFHVVLVKSPEVIDAPLYLCTDKCVCVCFRRWSEINLTASSKTSPQDHTGIMGVLSDVVTRLQNTEVICPVVAAQSKMKKETKE